jgi:hypothetical protein
MERYGKIIWRVAPILALIEQGLMPKDIKEEVIKSLEPFFDNKKLLNDFAIAVLIPESITLTKLEENKSFFEAFKQCLSVYRSAKLKDTLRCYGSIALLEPQIAQSLSKFWSVLNLEVNKSTLRLDEFLHECLRNIGDLIEDITKPYLKSLLLQIRIARGDKDRSANIDSLDLGNIINELIQKSGFPELFSPMPWNIRINQWRNIARHGTAKTNGDEIVCWYGKAPNITEVQLTREDMIKVVNTINMVYLTLKLAYTIFTVDNIEEVKKHVKFTKVREESEFTAFASALASQGFEIIEYNATIEEARLVVKDRSSMDPNMRRLHATQFLFPVWNLSKSKDAVVEYWERNGTPNLRVRINSNICEKVFDGELDVLTIAKEMEILDLKPDDSK